MLKAFVGTIVATTIVVSSWAVPSVADSNFGDLLQNISSGLVQCEFRYFDHSKTPIIGKNTQPFFRESFLDSKGMQELNGEMLSIQEICVVIAQIKMAEVLEAEPEVKLTIQLKYYEDESGQFVLKSEESVTNNE